jgi:Peptidase_C39 like family
MSKTLPVSIQDQECTEWCWAATTLAVCGCYGDARPTSQDDLANQVLKQPPGTACACKQDPMAPCNQPRNLASVLNTVNSHGRDGPAGVGAIRFQDLKDEIDANHPVVVDVLLGSPAASGHAIVIYGYTDDGIALLADPMHATDKISVRFDDFVSGNATANGKYRSAYRTKGSNE